MFCGTLFTNFFVILHPIQKEYQDMELHFTGILIALCTFIAIGLFHPLVIKTEYHTGTHLWWVFLVLGLICLGCAFFVADVFWSAMLGVIGASFLWSIGELFSQKKRVEKGWFPMNPKRKHEYQPIDKNETLCPLHHGKSIYAIEDER